MAWWWGQGSRAQEEGLTLERKNATPFFGTGGKEKGVDTDAVEASASVEGSVVGGD